MGEAGVAGVGVPIRPRGLPAVRLPCPHRLRVRGRGLYGARMPAERPLRQRRAVASPSGSVNVGPKILMDSPDDNDFVIRGPSLKRCHFATVPLETFGLPQVVLEGCLPRCPERPESLWIPVLWRDETRCGWKRGGRRRPSWRGICVGESARSRSDPLGATKPTVATQGYERTRGEKHTSR
jgi:hypothetical protein